jgi:hypothetical protein
MYAETLAAVRRDLALASFLWSRHPRQARRLVDAVGEVLFWLHYRPEITDAAATSAVREG